MLDPITSLSFSLHSSPGVFALLLGSGISKASGIPTGWDIVLDLIRKICILEEGKEASDPESWFKSKYDSEPNYNELLKEVAQTPAERRNLLKQYFEPNEKDKEEGNKMPSLAHRAIASLISRGYIKVVVTTNFDHLLEEACREAGVEPVVISDENDVSGAIPLIHSKCTIVKVNGDYLDERIRNTPEELSNYPKPINTLLDRVFDEFGLIVCGWSGEWDQALQNAIRKCRNRRFTTYWTHRSNISDITKKLCQHRNAHEIKIDDAGHFFSEIDEKIKSLESLDETHPVSAKIAIETVKRYLSKEEFKIKLEDLFIEELEKCYRKIASLSYHNEAGQDIENEIHNRFKIYEQCTDILLSMCITIAYYGTSKNLKHLLKVIKRLVSIPSENGLTILLNLSNYPLLLCLYGIGTAALASQNFSIVRGVLTFTYKHGRNDHRLIVDEVDYHRVLSKEQANKIKLCGVDNRKFPVGDYLFDYMKQKLSSILPSEEEFEEIYDKFDYFRCILKWDLNRAKQNRLFPYPGPFLYRDKMDSLEKEFVDEYEQTREKTWFLQDGLFDQNINEFTAASSELKQLGYWNNLNF